MVNAIERTGLRALFVGVFALSASACSLLNLQGFEVPACGSDNDCNALNEAEGIDSATACELYQCVEGSASGGCVFRRRDDDEDGAVAASCGGDDCDDTDPDAFPGAPVVGTALITGVNEPAWASWAPAPNAAALSYGLGGNDAAFDVLTPGEERAPTQMSGASDAMDMFGTISSPALELGCLSAGESPPTNTFPDDPITPMADRCATHEDCQDGNFCNGYERCDPASAGGTGDAMGCVPATEVPCANSFQCDGTAETCRSVSLAPTCMFEEVALAPVREDAYFAAQIQGSGCSAGRVSVGWLSSAEIGLERGAPGPNIVTRGGEGRAPSFTGIDVANAPACTGRQRADGAPLGASAPAVASLPQDVANGRLRPQALVAWQAAPTCRSTGGCSGEPGATGPVQVEVIGAWDEQQAGSNNINRWVSVTGSGAQQALDTAASGTARPAIAAVDAGADAGYVMAYGAAGGGIVARWIPAFSDPTYAEDTDEFGVFRNAAPYATFLPGDTAIRETRDTPAIADLGSETMLTDSGGADGVVLAAGPVGPMTEMLMAWVEGGAVYTAKVTLDAAGGTLMAGMPAQVSTGSDASRPEVVYIERGLCGPECGGFAVTWVESGQGQLARFEENGDAIDTTPVVVGSASFVRAYQAEGAMQIAWHDPSQQQLLISNGQCPPAM